MNEPFRDPRGVARPTWRRRARARVRAGPRSVAAQPPRVHKSLTVNAASLMIATLATSGFGFVFWLLAAHLRAPAVVGRASAAIAALSLLATIAQLNLSNLYVRYLPIAGRLGHTMVRRGYVAATVLSLVVGTVYVASGLSASVVSGGLGVRVLFVLAVVVLAIFALQDSVLTALRLAPWVPVENISFAVAKLLLLPLLVLLGIGAGIVLAWVLPAAAAVLVVSLLLFRWVLPARGDAEGTLPDRRRLLSFTAGVYVGDLFLTATLQLMPLLVLARLGAAEAAYLTLPWQVLMGLTFLLANVAMTFEVEIVNEGLSRALVRRGVLLWSGIVLAAVVVCVLGAGPLLSLAGARYAAHGAALLRLVGLSTPFGAVIALYCTLLQLDQRVWTFAAFQGAICVAVLGLTIALLPPLGLVAAGWAILSVQALAAAVMVPLAVRRVKRGGLARAA